MPAGKVKSSRPEDRLDLQGTFPLTREKPAKSAKSAYTIAVLRTASARAFGLCVVSGVKQAKPLDAVSVLRTASARALGLRLAGWVKRAKPFDSISALRTAKFYLRLAF